MFFFPNNSFTDLILFQFGREKCEPKHKPVFHKPDHFLFHYILSGKGRLFIYNDMGVMNEHKLSAGQGFMIWPNQNATYEADEEDPWEYTWVEFEGNQARKYVGQAGLRFNQPIYMSKDTKDTEKMVNEMLFMSENYKSPDLEIMSHFYMFVHLLVYSSSNQYLPSENNLQMFYIQEATHYTKLNYHLGISVQDIATHCNIHRTYLTRIFKNLMNTTPQQYLLKYRIDRAKSILSNSDKTIGEVSKLVGFLDQLSFSKAFKREVGKSPQQWKKSLNM